MYGIGDAINFGWHLKDHHEEFNVTTSSISSLGRVLFVQLYCCYVPEGEDISGVRHETTVDCLCIRCRVRCEKCCSMNCVVHRNMEGLLRAHEKYAMIIERTREMKEAIYGPVRWEEMINAGRVESPVTLSSVPSFFKRVKDAPGLFEIFCSLCSRSSRP